MTPVASFTDAWIETETSIKYYDKSKVASFTDAWIETKMGVLPLSPTCRIFYRCVDWNYQRNSYIKIVTGRIFYRCVDWNIFVQTKRAIPSVASFTDAWIETSWKAGTSSSPCVASFTDAWIETALCRCANIGWKSHLLQMRGLKRFWIFRKTANRRVASFTDAWIETSS